jgi:hypothetical protein
LNFLYVIECPIKKGNEAEKEETGDFVGAEADLSEVNAGFVVEFTISFSENPDLSGSKLSNL